MKDAQQRERKFATKTKGGAEKRNGIQPILRTENQNVCRNDPAHFSIGGKHHCLLLIPSCQSSEDEREKTMREVDLETGRKKSGRKKFGSCRITSRLKNDLEKRFPVGKR